MLKDQRQWARLEAYVRDMPGAFGQDDRIVVWDLYNEPGNYFLVSLKLPPVLRSAGVLGQLVRHWLVPGPTRRLLYQAFAWARAENPRSGFTISCGRTVRPTARRRKT